jgi:RNA polymerase sigma-B factor
MPTSKVQQASVASRTDDDLETSRPTRQPHARLERNSREALITRHLPLARKLAWRYARTSVPLDDLIQVASLALVKAVDRFDPDRGSAFEAFAVPTILGELKRYFRESTWAVHLTRGAQERALAVSEATDALSNRNGRSPTVQELAGYLEFDQEQVLEALQAVQAYTTSSLDEPRPGADDDGATIASSLGADDDSYERVEARLAVAGAMHAISAEDRRILQLRFFDEMTQSQIAKRMGVSQMQVSRRLRRSIARLRTVVAPDSAPAHPSSHNPVAPDSATE